MKKHIGDYVKEVRSDLGLTVREFGRLVGISGSYINQVEQTQKTLSKKKLFDFILFFNVKRRDLGINLPADEIIKVYCENKNISYERIYTEYEELRLSEGKMQATLADDLTTGRAEKDKDGYLKKIDKPYYNLKWLLTQKDNEVILYDELEHDNGNIEFSRDVLTEDDKKKLLAYAEALPALREMKKLNNFNDE